MSCLVFVFVSPSSVSPYSGEYQACQSHQNHTEKYSLTFYYSEINRTNFTILYLSLRDLNYYYRRMENHTTSKVPLPKTNSDFKK